MQREVLFKIHKIASKLSSNIFKQIVSQKPKMKIYITFIDKKNKCLQIINTQAYAKNIPL